MPADLKEIQDLAIEVKKNFEDFKKTNDEKLAAIEKKGHADPLLEEKLAKLNKAMDDAEVKRGKLEMELKARNDALEAAMKRMSSTEVETKTELADGTIVETKANEIARKSYADFLRKGKGSDIEGGRQGWTPSADEIKTMAVRQDPDGGFTVSADMNGRLVSHIFETSPIRQVANVVTISTDALEGMFDLDELDCGWVSESGSRSATGTPKIGKYRIQVHELYANPQVTQTILDDSALDIEAYLAKKIADKLARTENAAFVAGNGVGKPKGFLSYADGTSWTQSTKQIEQVTSAVQNLFDFDSLIDIVYKLKEPYRSRAQWAFGRLAFPLIRKLQDTQKRYLWEPSLQVGMPSSLLGLGIVEMNDFPTLAAGSLAAALADWNEAYQIVDRQGVRVLRDPFTSKPNVSFYTTKRTGGEVINGEAIKIYKLHA
jgi:HK97 family phage major capsid protein